MGLKNKNNNNKVMATITTVRVTDDQSDVFKFILFVLAADNMLLELLRDDPLYRGIHFPV